MEEQMETVVVLEEGNDLNLGPLMACCLSAYAALI